MGEKVTVIIFAHGQLEGLSESLESVMSQTYPDIEIIVVGAAVTDTNFRDFLSKHRAIYLENDSAQYTLMINEALNVATGRYVAFLHEGDTFSPKKIELLVETLNKNPEYGLICTAYDAIAEDGNIQDAVYIPEFSRQDVLFVLLYGHILGESTIAVRRECFQDIKHWESIETELDLWIQITRRYKVGVINSPLAKQRIRPRKGINIAISRALAYIPLDGIFPYVSSQPENSLVKSSALAVRGAVLMKHRLYKSAMDSFTETLRLFPDASLLFIWVGLLALQTNNHQAAQSYFARILVGDAFYFDAQWIKAIASEAQNASPEIQGRINVELGKLYDNLLSQTIEFAAGKLLDSTQRTPDVAEDICLYLNCDIPQVFKALFNGTSMAADEWNRKSPETPDEAVDFYKEAENYIFDLACWHRDPGRKKLTETSIGICKQNNVMTVLDFGCGIGQDGILFSEAGFDVTIADLPGKTYDFARWRVEKRNLDIKLISSDRLEEEYDAITCFDVLEHVWEPRETLEYLHHHISDNGILLVTANFEHDHIHPMHLEQNARYKGEEFLRMMSSVGFRREKGSSMPMVFRKISQG